MKFFIPFADAPEREAHVYNAIKQHLQEQLGARFSERRICALRWHHDGKEHTAKVGERTTFNGEMVIAILHEPGRDLYHVCTTNRGVVTDGSILAGGLSVIDSEDFEA